MIWNAKYCGEIQQVTGEMVDMYLVRDSRDGSYDVSIGISKHKRNYDTKALAHWIAKALRYAEANSTLLAEFELQDINPEVDP